MKHIDIGTIIPDAEGYQYNIISELGSGGFATVYKAERIDTHKFYAVKVLNSHDSDHLFSIKNEYEKAKDIHSEHAIELYYLNENGVNDFPSYIIMEYADGGNLKGEIDRRKKVGQKYSNKELLIIYKQLASGMKAVDDVIVHRDIKPANILIANGVLKISDYGLAKSAGAGTRTKTLKGAGTEPYYAPETYADPAAHGQNTLKMDIYAMGIVFYELANLRYPYDVSKYKGVGRIDYGSVHTTAPILPFDSTVDASLQSLIRKMMAKRPKLRYDSWDEIIIFLNGLNFGKASDPFVDNLVRVAEAKNSAAEAKELAEKSEEEEKKAKFRRLVSQVQDEIIQKLQDEVIDPFNTKSATDRMTIENQYLDDEDESFEFDLVKTSENDEDDAREIHFEFYGIHPEEGEVRFIPLITEIGGYPINRGSGIQEYKYQKRHILLWGVVEADCGSGINIMIIEDPDDPMYGDMKTVVKTPNIDGYNVPYSIPRSDLGRYCVPNYEFQDINATAKVTDDVIPELKNLISMNEVFHVGQVNRLVTTIRFR